MDARAGLDDPQIIICQLDRPDDPPDITVAQALEYLRYWRDLKPDEVLP